jgi:hypothetical protein
MRTLILMALMVSLLPHMAAAEQAKKAPPVNPCAQYGAGFVQVKGTTTCVKVGGSTRIDIGSSRESK